MIVALMIVAARELADGLMLRVFILLYFNVTQ